MDSAKDDAGTITEIKSNRKEKREIPTSIVKIPYDRIIFRVGDTIGVAVAVCQQQVSEFLSTRRPANRTGTVKITVHPIFGSGLF
jgi:hypothetical protein